MRGMAVEARFRPNAIADWLLLLPIQSPQAKPIPQHTVATVAFMPSQHKPVVAASQRSIIKSSAKSPLLRGLLIGGGVALVGAVGAVAFSSVFSNSNQQQPTPAGIQPSSDPSPDVVNTESTSPPTIERNTAPPVQTTQPSRRRRSRLREVLRTPVQTPSPSPSVSESPIPVQSPTLTDTPTPVETPPPTSQEPVQPPTPETPPPVVVDTQPAPSPVIVQPKSSGEANRGEANDDSKRQRRDKPDNDDKQEEKQRRGKED